MNVVPLLQLAQSIPEPAGEVAWLLNLCDELAAVPARDRNSAVAAVAEKLARSRAAVRWTHFLSERAETIASHLALALTAWLPLPLEEELVQRLQPFLSRKQIPGAIRLDAATVLLQSSEPDGQQAGAILHSLLTRTGKARAVDRIQLLMQRLGTLPLLKRVCAQLEPQIRMHCPRCRMQLRRADMTEHLWTEHRLVLEGRKAREPWGLIQEWLDQHARWNRPDLLNRCHSLAERLEGEVGLIRLNRLLLQSGVDHPQAHAALAKLAREQRASLCPRCLNLVPLPSPALPVPLTVSHGRLFGHGYSVSVTERGLVPQLEITTPTATLYRGREPGRRFTRRGATMLLAGPPVLVALLLGLVLSLGNLPLVVPVLILLALAALIAFGISLVWWNSLPPLDRALDQAWQYLAPSLHADGSNPAEAGFLIGLAELSTGRGSPELRREILVSVLHEAESSVRGGRLPLHGLAALHRLQLADTAARREGDAPMLIASQVRRCLAGELPLAFAHELLRSDLALAQTSGDRARLLVLLCDAAFEAGFEMRDLQPIAGTLGGLAIPGRQEKLAQLRLLWSLRAAKPWRKWGEGWTAFELASDPAASDWFSRHPDLLLVDGEGPEIVCTCDGVVVREHTFYRMPDLIEVAETRRGGEFHYDLIVGKERLPFWHNPASIRARLEGWLRFWFREFQPGIPNVFDWHSPAPPRLLLASQAAKCPECATLLWTRLGEVGYPVVDGTRHPRPAGTSRALPS